MKRLPCRLALHQWSKWQEKEIRTTAGARRGQERQCFRCGLKETRLIQYKT